MNHASGSVLRAWEGDDDVGGRDVPVVHCRDLQAQLQPVTTQCLDTGQQLEGALYVLCDPVSHQLEYTVWWNERDLPVHVELRQSHALMKPVVVQRNALVGRFGPHLAGHDELVVHAELALGHAGEQALHQDLTGDVGAQALPLGRHEDVDILDDIDVNFVLPVLDALCPPGADASGLDGDLLQLLLVVQVHRLGIALRDVLL
mmetsp:Transcript_13265/g.41906  ORF Transcript_13265/g.41906 Transcript_13265/m.41906 type:complete len:203 (+) Transcript_13265:333-941(+)